MADLYEDKLKEMGVTVNADIELDTMSHLLSHEPKVVGRAIMYINAYVDGHGYQQIRRVVLKNLTVDQVKLLQQLQLAFIEDAPIR